MNSPKENDEIPGMNLENNYSPNQKIPTQTKIEKEAEKTKKELEKLKGFILKKYPFTQALGILPHNAAKNFIEDELGKIDEKHLQTLQKKVHIYMIIPEEKFKETQKIKTEIVREIDSKKYNVWLQIKTPVDMWNLCLDSKFDLISPIAVAYPLYDDGILSALRVAEIHKSLVLRKFEKYVVSYVLGGSLVRGDAVKTSDVDVFVIINDTDVRRMPRLELKERLRGIIFQYISEATALAGVKKNVLNVQVYLLTEFWESVKDANPVMFTFIRDGIPIYDRGIFLPWKALLKMGKLKPSPEAIDMFMSAGDKTIKRAKLALMDILLHDLYWGVITPSQALLMLYGLPPPTPKQIVKDIEKNFVEKEKILERKYLNILSNIVGLYKDYEHEKLKEIKGAEIDKLLKDTEDYLKRLKELRDQIEKRTQEKTIEEISKDIFGLLEKILGKKPGKQIIEEFDSELIKKGVLPEQSLRTFREIIQAESEFKKGKSNSHKINEARKNATILIGELIDYSQRRDISLIEKSRIKIKYKEKGKERLGSIIVANGMVFFVTKDSVDKLTNKLEKSNTQELSKAMESQKPGKSFEINPKIFEILKKHIGSFEIVL